MLKKLFSLAIVGLMAYTASAQKCIERRGAELTAETPRVTVKMTPLQTDEPVEGVTFKSNTSAMYAAKDYTLEATVPSCANNNIMPLTLNVGKDIKGLRYLCVEGDFTDSENNFDLVAQYGDELAADNDDLGSKALELSLTLELTTERSARFTLLIVGMSKADGGSRLAQLKTYFYSINSDDDNWKTLGNAYYVDDIVANMYSSVYSTSTYVSVQEHKTIAGYYRIVNPYGTGWSYNYKNKYSHQHKHYIYIHAENPNRVYLDESPIGADLGHGGISVASMATPGFTTGSLTQYYGTMVDHVITFPAKALLLSMQNYNSGQWFKANTNAKFRITIPPTPQTITWDQTFPTVYPGDTVELTATASSGLDVRYTIASSAADLATIEGNTLTLLAPGTITITAWQDGDNKLWAGAPTITRQIVCEEPQPQSIVWEQDFTMAFVHCELTLEATATSGLDVTYSLAEGQEHLATLVGNTLAIHAPGTVTVTASQEGNGMWAPAEDVVMEIECTYEQTAAIVGAFNGWDYALNYVWELTPENRAVFVVENYTNGEVDDNNSGFLILYMRRQLGSAELTLANGEWMPLTDAAGEHMYLPAEAESKTVTFSLDVETLSLMAEWEPDAVVMPGDANCDGEVTIADVVCVCNRITGFNPEVFSFEAADLNGDGEITVADIVFIVNMILNGSAQ